MRKEEVIAQFVERPDNMALLLRVKVLSRRLTVEGFPGKWSMTSGMRASISV
jgi:hypothetical protein